LVLGVGELHALATLTFGKQPREVLCISCFECVKEYFACVLFCPV
jgi:hypothetical protein